MLTMKKLTLMGTAGALWGLSALLLSPMAHAVTYSDAGAAVVVYPKIVVNGPQDTVVTITNQARSLVSAHCFYVNANNRCTNTGQQCTHSIPDCVDTASGFTGSCVGSWIEVNFDVVLTPEQPVAWSASEGLSNTNTPCPGGLMGGACPHVCKGGTADGALCSQNIQCPGGSCVLASNAGTRVPAVGENPFIGELKCIESDPITRLPKPCNTLDCSGDPANCCRADLEGSAIITTVESDGVVDAERYNAVGLRPTGFNNGDRTLTIGGTPPSPDDTCLDLPVETRCEYEPCASVLVLNLLFDSAVDPISNLWTTRSELTLVPCTQDFLVQRIPEVTAQFLVYNEFEQRLSTSRLVDCLLNSQISLIDTSQSERSIFSAALQGTVAGQARITGVGGGLIGAASLAYCDPMATDCTTATVPPGRAAYNLNQFADREEADFIRIP